MQIEHEFISWVTPLYQWAKKYNISDILSCIESDYNKNEISMKESQNKLSKITELWIEGVDATEMPEEILNLTNLLNLRIHGMGYDELNHTETDKKIYISDEVYIENKKMIFISQKKLLDMFKLIYQIKSLTSLSIGQINITEMPEGLHNLRNLEILQLDRINLKELPVELGDLKHLSDLSINGNLLSSLPSDIMMKLKHLTSLSIDSVLLNKEIVLLQTIKSLSEIILPVEELDDTTLKNLSSLPNLKDLWICGEATNSNKGDLEEIPPKIGLLTNLEELVIIDAPLRLIAREISKLQKLKTLSITDTRLIYLPSEITMLTNLKEVSFDDIVIKCLTSEQEKWIKNIEIITE